MNEQQATEAVLRALGEVGLSRARPGIPSETLRRALRLVIDSGTAEAKLFIPHYWAVYLHDGHGSFGPKRARFLVYFARSEDDPRFPGKNAPERFTSIRRLTRSEFEDGLERNAENRRLGLSPFMFVVKRSGPKAGTFFFENDVGMAGFTREVTRANSAPGRIFDQFIQSLVITDKRTALIRL